MPRSLLSSSSGATQTADMRLVDVDRGEVKLPDSETVVPIRYPGSAEAVANQRHAAAATGHLDGLAR